MTNTSNESVKRGSVMIVGGGIGGMQAALDLADSGFKVHLMEKQSSIGGTMVMLDKTFPTGDCSMCMISPKMVEVGRHQNIILHTLTDVLSVSGEPGNFKVLVRENPRYVDAEKCTGCGLCDKKCPKLVPNEFDQQLNKRKAIYSMFPQAVPNTRVIDRDNCLYFQRGRCKACEKFCPADAINFEDQPKEFDIYIGAIILSPGLDRYNPQVRQELGFGRWPNVVTSVQFERILSASGPYMGEVRRPVDERHPRKVAWIQCVGSRDFRNANPWCSSVCCMYATKQAVIAKEHDSHIEPVIFYMEMRAFGKDFDKYVDRAKNEYGVEYKRAMISDIKEEAGTHNLIIRYAKENGELVDEIYDMVVLSIGFQPRADAIEMAKTYGISPNDYGFARTTTFQPVDTDAEGIYVTGIYQGPKDIPETVVQGSAVAGRVMSLLGDARGTEVTQKALPDEIDVSQAEPKIGVFVCHCGINISQSVDIEQVVGAVKDQKNVVYADDLMYACAPDGQEKIKDLVREHGLNRVVVASCTPRTHSPLFQDTIRDAGLNKYLFELADIREQCSWCHMGRKEDATKKAIDIVKMTVAKTRHFEAVQTDSIDVNSAALIIGGGVAGMTTALSLADQGFKAYIVEKDAEIGGLVKNVYQTLDQSDVQEFLKMSIQKVNSNPNIIVHTNAQVEKTDGFVGNFVTTLTNGETFEHGAVIVCTGGHEYEPTEYEYKNSDRIITQRQLEKDIHTSTPKSGAHYVMIQCVGSREEPNNYCSRVCCQDAVKNAISIKEKQPDAQVTILYRDIRTYGLREDYYHKAREMGVLFIRFNVDQKPEVEVKGNTIQIETFDYMLDRKVRLQADYLVLSVGLRPHETTQDVGSKYKLTRNMDGFFLEAHVKLRPVDFPSEGIYVAGLAHAPKNLDETISQALAAAGRAGVLLSHDKLGVSGIISKHNRDLCMSCLACFRVCPFGSPFIDEDGKVSHNEVKCTGCGICAGVCPAKAFQVNTFKDNQIHAMIDAMTDDLDLAA
jgi:heterodisulfide reductase subunit A